ncbi:glycine-rich domain-containing protein [Sphingomonas sp. Leaf17]|uniref:glycine-rich domain-containing protein n=1 Tax=Sphingomonas sp. Leaf17 TaxID=1735683 RepID=UPI000A6F330E|nr:hypothetical protein [Sphingomonas sp. Leaf17]
MLPTDRALLTAIERLTIDPPGAALTFVDRLARDNGWDRDHATAVDREYRRFLFLAATADAPVTPSDAVDQAWHLHLAYSRSYWDDLCGQIIGRPLHHCPTAGGPVEDDRYAGQYSATLRRYADAFGEAPPTAIWPPVDQRFTERFVRIAITPPAPFTARRIVVGVVIVLIVGLAAFLLTGSAFGTAMVIGAVAIGLIAAEAGSAAENRPRKRRKGDGDGLDGPDNDGGDGCGADSGGCGGGCGGGD